MAHPTDGPVIPTLETERLRLRSFRKGGGRMRRSPRSFAALRMTRWKGGDQRFFGARAKDHVLLTHYTRSLRGRKSAEPAHACRGRGRYSGYASPAWRQGTRLAGPVPQTLRPRTQTLRPR